MVKQISKKFDKNDFMPCVSNRIVKYHFKTSKSILVVRGELSKLKEDVISHF